MAAASFSVKEIVLDVQSDVKTLSGKFDAYLALHDNRHMMELQTIATANADASATASGRSLLSDINELGASGRETRRIVDRHDVLIQRLIGAAGLISFLLAVLGVVVGIHAQIHP